jgi:hypothetical protein
VTDGNNRQGGGNAAAVKAATSPSDQQPTYSNRNPEPSPQVIRIDDRLVRTRVWGIPIALRYLF